MFKHILVPVDGGELAERAAQLGLDLAATFGASVTGFVAEPMPPLPKMSESPTLYKQETDAYQSRTEAHARAVLDAFRAMAGQRGVPFQGKSLRAHSVDDAIVKAAAEYGCDLIVMVTHGRGAFGELMFGSHTKNVMTKGKTPLLVFH